MGYSAAVAMLGILPDTTGGRVAQHLADMGTRVSKMSSIALRTAAYSYIEAAIEQTPVLSGNLLMNWHISATGQKDDYDDRLKREFEAREEAAVTAAGPKGRIKWIERASRGPIEAEVLLRAQGEALEIDRDKNVSHVEVYNSTPYAHAVDAGSSTNAPSAMTDAGAAAAERALASMYLGLNTVEYADTMQLMTKIGRRKAGE